MAATKKDRVILLLLLVVFYAVLLGSVKKNVIKDWPAGAPQFPSIRSIGAITSKGGALTLSVPAGFVDGDLLIAFIQTRNEVITLADWTEAACSPSTRGATCPGDSNCTRVTVFYTTSITVDDNWTTSDSGDRQMGGVIAVTEGTYNAGDPFDACRTSTQTGATQDVIILGTTTTIDDTMVFAAASGDSPDKNSSTEFSAPANSNLSAVTEQIDKASNTGGGGSLVVITGTLATYGAVGTTTATAGASAQRANIQISVNSNP